MKKFINVITWQHLAFIFAMVGVRIKHALFRNSGWLSAVVLAAMFVFAWQFAAQNWQIVVTVAGGILSLVYFVQKQKLEELRLFKELFVEFNARYDSLSNGLLPIARRNDGELSKEESLIVYQYFNLCAEEFLFYRLGYIDPAAWFAWRNGMRIYFANPLISRLWDNDSKSDSYYGLQAALSELVGSGSVF